MSMSKTVNNPQDELLTVRELCKRIRSSPPQINYWINTWELPIVSEDPRLISLKAFEAWYDHYLTEKAAFEALFARKMPSAKNLPNEVIVILEGYGEIGRFPAGSKKLTAGMAEQAKQVYEEFLATEPDLPLEHDPVKPKLRVRLVAKIKKLL